MENIIKTFNILTATDIKYLLSIKRYFETGKIKKVFIGRSLKVSRPSVNSEFKKLQKLGFIIQKTNYEVILTDKCKDLFLIIDKYQRQLSFKFTSMLRCDYYIAQEMANLLLINKKFELIDCLLKNN